MAHRKVLPPADRIVFATTSHGHGSCSACTTVAMVVRQEQQWCRFRLHMTVYTHDMLLLSHRLLVLCISDCSWLWLWLKMLPPSLLPLAALTRELRVIVGRRQRGPCMLMYRVSLMPVASFPRFWFRCRPLLLVCEVILCETFVCCDDLSVRAGSVDLAVENRQRHTSRSLCKVVVEHSPAVQDHPRAERLVDGTRIDHTNRPVAI